MWESSSTHSATTAMGSQWWFSIQFEKARAGFSKWTLFEAAIRKLCAPLLMRQFRRASKDCLPTSSDSLASYK